MIKEIVKSGNAKLSEAAAQQKDTKNGAALLTETKTVQLIPPLNLIGDRLAKIHQFNLLSEKRKKLIDTQDDLREFETAMNGEKDEIELSAADGKEIVTIRRPDAVKKCLALIKEELSTALLSNENEILNCKF